MTLYLLSTLLASILILDVTYIGQFMLSEPLFMLPLLGLASGRPEEGILAGMNLEFVFLGRLAVGASIPPSAGFAAGVFWGAVLLGPGDSAWYLPALFFPSLLAGYWGREIDHLFRKLHNGWSESAFRAFSQSGRYARFSRYGTLSALLFVAANWASILLFSWLIHKGTLWLAPFWEISFRGPYAAMIWKGLPVMGVLFLLDRFNDKKNNGYLMGGMAGGLLIGGVLWAFF
ncbi:MAG TPA: PTS sugar transporter subunit IIC [Candidatus Mcinerneyibacteriales bacterium]|nr:PTS sugar transporter subunit IIC [Candidatus Mcinerneyibacteriales bacterium]HPE20389.1 PTS sugar transporter subunit IIC [Candidatus Mcinerneyibacteriales bacterium]HPJ69550.1 PTS sugar transporter subunit IIC [Candidatus Mcinerneyibacteriales bacterium]HPQ88755.1 PTS sugar transporter subunit IIC [Candidatus Mcinerneyibacteriales bacterium]